MHVFTLCTTLRTNTVIQHPQPGTLRIRGVMYRGRGDRRLFVFVTHQSPPHAPRSSCALVHLQVLKPLVRLLSRCPTRVVRHNHRQTRQQSRCTPLLVCHHTMVCSGTCFKRCTIVFCRPTPQRQASVIPRPALVATAGFTACSYPPPQTRTTAVSSSARCFPHELRWWSNLTLLTPQIRA